MGLVVDVVGFYADSSGTAGSRFHGLAPSRAFDTRDGTGGVPIAPLGPHGILKFAVPGMAGIPASGVTAVVMNVTVTDPTAASFVTVYPDDVVQPVASNLNFVPGQTVPNLVVVRIPASGVIDFYNHAGTTDVLADIVGYYDADKTTEAGRFVGVVPTRLVDTRDTRSPFGPGEIRRGGLSNSGAESAVLNVTATEPTTPGYLTVFPADNCIPPLASNLNFVAGETVPNLVIVQLSKQVGCATITGAAGIYNFLGYTHVIVDLFGYFTAP